MSIFNDVFELTFKLYSSFVSFYNVITTYDSLVPLIQMIRYERNQYKLPIYKEHDFLKDFI